MNTKIQRARVQLYMSGEYLVLQISSRRERLSRELGIDLEKEDMIIHFWGHQKIREVLSSAPITTKERQSLRRGGVVRCLYPQELLPEWVLKRQRIRANIDRINDRIDTVCNELSRFCSRQEKLRERAQFITSSDTIPYMDGSALFWLSMILTAKKDFLKFYWDPEKYSNEDYLGAAGFLFDDDYHIPFDSPEEMATGHGVYINMRDLLGLCMEQYARSDTGDICPVEPSADQLRASVARATGDERLISKFCIQFTGNEFCGEPTKSKDEDLLSEEPSEDAQFVEFTEDLIDTI